MWNKLICYADTALPNTRITAEFNFINSIAEALSFKLSCGCSSGEWNPVTQTLKVVSNTGNIPEHLSEYVFTKYVTVSYTVNGQQQTDVLTINALIIKL